MNKRTIITTITIIIIVMVISGWIRAKKNMPFISKDICINKGEFIMINWDASETDVEKALQWWMNNK